MRRPLRASRRFHASRPNAWGWCDTHGVSAARRSSSSSSKGCSSGPSGVEEQQRGVGALLPPGALAGSKEEEGARTGGAYVQYGARSGQGTAVGITYRNSFPSRTDWCTNQVRCSETSCRFRAVSNEDRFKGSFHMALASFSCVVLYAARSLDARNSASFWRKNYERDKNVTCLHFLSAFSSLKGASTDMTHAVSKGGSCHGHHSSHQLQCVEHPTAIPSAL